MEVETLIIAFISGLGRDPTVHCGGRMGGLRGEGEWQKKRFGLLLDNIFMQAVLFMVVSLSLKINPNIHGDRMSHSLGCGPYFSDFKQA